MVSKDNSLGQVDIRIANFLTTEFLRESNASILLYHKEHRSIPKQKQMNINLREIDRNILSILRKNVLDIERMIVLPLSGEKNSMNTHK